MKTPFLTLLYCVLFTAMQAQTTVTICNGSSTALVAGNPNNWSAPSFTLLPGSIVNATGSFVVSPQTNITYTIALSGLDVNQQTQMRSTVFIVNVAAQPSIAPTVTQSTCQQLNSFNLNLTFNPGGSSSYSVNWSNQPWTVTSSTQTSGYIAPPGAYQVTVVTTAGCSATANLTINPKPANPSFTPSTPLQNGLTINCNQPTITITNTPGNLNYVWSRNTQTISGSSITFTTGMAGTWTVKATDASGCDSSVVFSLTQNFFIPTVAVTPMFQNITCTPSTVTQVTIISQGVNYVTSPSQGVFKMGSVGAYFPGGPGTYTACSVDISSGCKTCKTFTVSSTSNFPTFTLTSPASFTLGCSTKSVAPVNISNAQSHPNNQNPLSYTIMASGNSTSVTGPFGSITNYSINLPGSYTVIVMDNTNLCMTRVPFTISPNTGNGFGFANSPTLVTCSAPTLAAQAPSYPNTSIVHTWSVVGTGSVITGQTVQVNANTAAPSGTIAAVLVLESKDTTNLCSFTQTITVAQTLFPPIGIITPTGNLTLSCLVPTLQLLNQSSTGSPKNGNFPYSMPIVAQSWFGPTPSAPAFNSYSFAATVPGTYTLNIIDPNNGCTATKTFVINDNLNYPVINNPNSPGPSNLCFSPTATLAPIITSSPDGLTFTWSAPAGAITSNVSKTVLITNAAGVYTFSAKNSEGCVTQVTMEVVYCLNIGQKQRNANFELFPNPVNDKLTVSGLTHATYTWLISDISGRQVIIGRFEGKTEQIDTRSLPAGAYVITITNTAGMSESHRLLKE